MPTDVFRAPQSERLFPEPALLWQGAGMAQGFLGLADASSSPRRRAGCADVPVLQRLGRMLGHLRSAMAKEESGHWRAADAYWKAMELDYVIVADGDDWPEVDGCAGRDAAARFRDEVLVDVGCALVNGLLHADAPPLDRLRLQIFRLLERPDDPACRQRLTEQAAGALLALGGKGSAWPGLRAILGDLSAKLPDSLPVAKAVWLAAYHDGLTALTDGTAKGKTNPAPAELARSAVALIDRLEYQRKKCDPLDVDILNALSTLHHLRAAYLAKAGQLSEALVEADHAIAFCGDDQSRKLFADISEAMTSLQQRCAEVQDMLSKTPGQTLSVEGEKIMEEARAGFSRVNARTNSGAMIELRSLRTRAVRRRFWHAAGLEPRQEDFDDAAAAFMEVFDSVAGEEDRAGWPSKLEAAAAAHPLLAGIDWRKVTEALDGGRPEAPAPAGPRLPVAAKRAFGDLEPFAYAFFAPEAKPLRLLAAAAALTLVVTAGLWGWEGWRRHSRDQAYDAMQRDLAGGRALAALNDAVAFLTAPPMVGDDHRTADVQRMYAKAIIVWFAALRSEPDDQARQILSTYRTLSGNNNGKGGVL